MAEAAPFLSIKRYAVVTGANKGIGFEICKQLASNGVKVVLTARDENKGLEALQKLHDLGFSDSVVFHQLDVTDPDSRASLADYVKSQFAKLDILVNNAGISGAIIDYDAIKTFDQIDWKKVSTQPHELSEECINTNYYGVKGVTEALMPLLQMSDSARIVNVSSASGQLKNMKDEWSIKVLSDAENLTEDKIDDVLHGFLRDSKDGSFERWHPGLAAYFASKAALNAYTRVMAKKYPPICINAVCPGFVKTDINNNSGHLSVEEGAESPVKLALMPKGGPSGLFFIRQEVSPF